MKLKITSILLITLSFNLFGASGDEGKVKNEMTSKTKIELLNDISGSSFLPKVEWTGRKVTATILSALIPGSGQTFLGEDIKGAAITLAFYGSAVAAVIAQNNFVAREDRIKMLTRAYLTENEFIKADQVWSQIKFEENNRKYDNQRRKIFTYTAAGIWLLNMLDVIFLSEDHGKDVFSLNSYGIPVEMNFAVHDNYSGVALKYNLP